MPNDIDIPPLYDPLTREDKDHLNDIWLDWFATFYQTLISYFSQFGFFLPELTTAQRDSIQNPQNGQLIYNTTLDAPQFFQASSQSWYTIMFT